MGKLYIEGNNILSGTIEISGAKNSAVALIPASLLCDEKVVINNVPEISDIDALIEILEYLEVEIIRNGDTLIIDPINIKNKMINEEISKKLRASYYFMSALLGRFKPKTRPQRVKQRLLFPSASVNTVAISFSLALVYAPCERL